jgi:hypothetical protein
MKSKNGFLMSVTILLLTGLLTFIFANSSWQQQSSNVSLTIAADKNNIYLGEVLNLQFEFTNLGETSVKVPNNGVMGGNVEILITKKGESFRKYFRSDWGRKDGELNVLFLGPKQRHKIDDPNATILWNGRPDYSHLNPDAAKRAGKQDNRILTDYAFPDAGTYLVKAVSCLIDELNGCSIPIESEPIEIKVNQPIGEDLEVWNRIKGNRGIAMLMQKGSLDTGNEAAKEELISQVKQIIETHPNSVYSGYLKSNLEKFKAKEAKRNEFYKNIKQPQKSQ